MPVIDFLGFQPSVIAAAAVISAAGEGVDVPESYYEKVNKVLIRDFLCDFVFLHKKREI